MVPGWMGYQVVVREDLPVGMWCLISGATLYMARGLRLMCLPANEERLVPDLDSPRDAAPERWR